MFMFIFNKLKTFPKGGIHPAENKITSAKAIKRMSVPKVVSVPIAQHIGIPSELLVNSRTSEAR